MKRFMIGSYNGRNAVSCLRFGLSRGSTRRRSYGVAYVHGYVLRLSGDQNMVVEGVSIQAETSRGRNLVTSEALVLALCPKVSQASRRSRWRRRCPGPFDGGDGTRRWRTWDEGLTHPQESARDAQGVGGTEARRILGVRVYPLSEVHMPERIVA
jgi:hypothetical protein